MLKFTETQPYLRKIADIANSIIKKRYGLGNGIVESSINPDIPFQPTLHWKTPTEFIACEVAMRPFPVTLKEQFAEIVSTGAPIRIIVAYPSDTSISLDEFKSDIRKLKQFGVGYLPVDEKSKIGKVEYKGISLALHLSNIDINNFNKKLRPSIEDAFEHYMDKGDPDVALQTLGQLTENIVYNIATEAKAQGKFTYVRFKPPKYIRPSKLLEEMINEKILDISILARCKDFAQDRNKVSHKPKSIKEAQKIEKKLKENFIIGCRILEDLPQKITEKGFSIKP